MKLAARTFLLGALLSPSVTPTSARAQPALVVGSEEGVRPGAYTAAVLLREGSTTVLTVQTSYAGPRTEFALVLPVPAPVDPADISIVDHATFAHLDRLTAPRLVEFHEADPCASAVESPAAADPPPATPPAAPASPPERAEYSIEILEEGESREIASWLRDAGYHLTAAAAAALTRHATRGHRFVIACVDPDAIALRAGRALLTPLRLHYESERFELPMNFGVDTSTTRDVILYIASKTARFEAANLPNVFAPTNLAVDPAVRDDFPAFYEERFTELLRGHPGALVTEYAWLADRCAPCAADALSDQELRALGADVAGPLHEDPRAHEAAAGDKPQGRGPFIPHVRAPRGGGRLRGLPRQFIITRMHLRWGPGQPLPDLVLQRAPAAHGGTGVPDQRGGMARSVGLGGTQNEFQARFALFAYWSDPLMCSTPQRGRWAPVAGPHVHPALALPEHGRLASAASRGVTTSPRDEHPRQAAPPRPSPRAAELERPPTPRLGWRAAPQEAREENARVVEESGGCAATDPASPWLVFAVLGWRRRGKSPPLR